nr:large subunit gtpase 1 [Quercus suber]
MFRSEDLEKYVKEVDSNKRNLLLVNKADMMTLEQRQAWAKYFTSKGINFKFFSAELAREMNEAREDAQNSGFNALEDEGEESSDEEGEDDEHDDDDDDDDDEGDENAEDEDDDDDDDELDEEDVAEEIDPNDVLAQEAKKINLQDKQEEAEKWVDEETVEAEQSTNSGSLSMEEQTRILTTDDLESLFLQHSPKIPKGKNPSEPTRKTQIGLVGYPNVGKSSTINALLGAKKVSVSATPGKTKHFQTIHLSPRVVLCDCPGLVFPNFSTTKGELVCNGVLPIDQLREYTGPATLVGQRIPQAFLEAIYGMRIETRPLEEGGTGIPTGEEVLRAYATARGFQTTGVGQPDESRAARHVLKDYVKGKLLYCHPPPVEPPIDGKHFNRDLYDAAHLPQKRRAHLAAAAQFLLHGGSDDVSLMDEPDMLSLAAPQGAKSGRLDKQFFAPGQGNGSLVKPFHHKYSEQGKALSGRKLKTALALEKDIDPADMKISSKKHFKGGKKAKGKVRGGGGEYV